ncbi:MAG: DUF1841 family protein [Nitrospirae bacterium]|nr:DUF1841 family protein [Nitrospirota bacterium]
MIFGQDRHELRKSYADAWQKYCDKQPMSALEAQIAAVISEHPEYQDTVASPELDREFTPEGGVVTVATRRSSEDPKRVVVEVRDTGVGIAADELDALFDKYRQTRSGRVSQEKGTGLGLVIAKRIAESHEGSISVESALGEGSKFTVRLPMGPSTKVTTRPRS